MADNTVIITLSFSAPDDELYEDFRASPILLPSQEKIARQYAESFGMVLENVAYHAESFVEKLERSARAADKASEIYETYKKGVTYSKAEAEPATTATPASPPAVTHSTAEPTEKQMDFLRKLHGERETGVTDLERLIENLKREGKFTRGHISETIDSWIGKPKKAGGAHTAPLYKKAPLAIPKLAPGFYTVGEEPHVQYFRVKASKTDPTRIYADKLLVRPDGTFEWMYDRGAIRTIAAVAKPITIGAASKWGKAYGRCFVCHRTLTDPESIAAGIGPVCASRLAL